MLPKKPQHRGKKPSKNAGGARPYNTRAPQPAAARARARACAVRATCAFACALLVVSAPPSRRGDARYTLRAAQQVVHETWTCALRAQRAHLECGASSRTSVRQRARHAHRGVVCLPAARRAGRQPRGVTRRAAPAAPTVRTRARVRSCQQLTAPRAAHLTARACAVLTPVA
jgi:hypothetical protein